MNLIEKALKLAVEAHEGQIRKYTKEPYIYHPIEVSRIVWDVNKDEAVIAAAICHDVIEDTRYRAREIEWFLGTRVCELVIELTDVSRPEDGNREKRKEIDRERLRKVSVDAKTIKLADLISNTDSIVEHDPDFAIVYMKEKQLLLEVLKEGDQTLYQAALERVCKYQNKRLQQALKPKGSL